MKKILLSLLAVVACFASSQAETLYKLNFAENLTGRQGGFNPNFGQYKCLTDFGIDYGLVAVNPALTECKYALTGYTNSAVNSYIVNLQPFANGEKINQIVITAFRYKDTDDMVTKAELQVLNDLEGEPIATYNITSQINGTNYTNQAQGQNFTSIPVSINAPAANLYYKLYFEIPQSSVNGWLAIAEIDYNNYMAPVQKVADPYFNPESGEVQPGTMVEIFCETSTANIYYSVDGSVPSATSPTSRLYNSPIEITEDVTIKAIGVSTIRGIPSSEVVEATYTVDKNNTGITEISGDVTAPVYYNLYGVKVDKPEKGIYIVVKDGKTTKTVF